MSVWWHSMWNKSCNVDTYLHAVSWSSSNWLPSHGISFKFLVISRAIIHALLKPVWRNFDLHQSVIMIHIYMKFYKIPFTLLHIYSYRWKDRRMNRMTDEQTWKKQYPEITTHWNWAYTWIPFWQRTGRTPITTGIFQACWNSNIDITLQSTSILVAD